MGHMPIQWALLLNVAVGCCTPELSPRCGKLGELHYGSQFDYSEQHYFHSCSTEAATFQGNLAPRNLIACTSMYLHATHVWRPICVVHAPCTCWLQHTMPLSRMHHCLCHDAHDEVVPRRRGYRGTSRSSVSVACCALRGTALALAAKHAQHNAFAPTSLQCIYQ
jgi:hypothetical protein